MMTLRDKIFVAGAQTLIGSALEHRLNVQGFETIDTTQNTPDFCDVNSVERFFKQEQPDYVFVTAGKSGGIDACTRYAASFMMDNLLVACHIIDTAHKYGVKKLLYLGSSSCYPKLCPQPMQVSSLLTSPLDKATEYFALAKIVGMKLCLAYKQQYGDNFICGITSGTFGPGDNFDPKDSQVVAALIRRMHEAKVSKNPSIVLWGSGTPRRELTYVDDMAEACIFVMQNYEDEIPINLGSGLDLSIAELAEYIREVVDYDGEVIYDTDYPDGMIRKSLDTTPLQGLGWKAKTDFKFSLNKTYAWFLENYAGKHSGSKL